MSLLAWIIVGFISGLIASMLVGEDAGCGCGTNVIVGMVGSLIGGSLLVLLSTGQLDLTTAFTQLNLRSIIVSTLGAIVFLSLLRFFRGRHN